MEELLANPYVGPLVLTVAIILVFPLIVGYMVLAERKVLADLQVRLGPMRVGPYGVLQPLADALKLLLKEDIIPARADKWIFWLAPVLSVFTGLTALAVLPLSDRLYVADVNIGILFILAMSSIGALGLILGGWSANSKYSLMGSLRAAAQMVSYEVPLGFATVTAIMCAGTLSMQGVIDSQFERGVWGAFDNYGLMLIPTVLFIIAGTAETNRAPFDLPEAESELVAGFHTEYSGFRWSLFFLAEYAAIVVISALCVTLFFGGWLRPFPNVELLEIPFNTVFPAGLCLLIAFGCLKGVGKQVVPGFRFLMAAIAAAFLGAAGLFVLPLTNELVIGLFWFAFKLGVMVYLFIWYRGTFPRFRYDQLMDVGWKWLIPISMAGLVLNGAVQLLARG
ncbi:MAG: NADH-quinone oxidoreductase subunit H [Bryobacterales bacterium]|nr:NADH-quinone oxidoreductase subunit H [Bryobacterales bacterium]